MLRRSHHATQQNDLLSSKRRCYAVETSLRFPSISPDFACLLVPSLVPILATHRTRPKATARQPQRKIPATCGSGKKIQEMLRRVGLQPPKKLMPRINPRHSRVNPLRQHNCDCLATQAGEKAVVLINNGFGQAA